MNSCLLASIPDRKGKHAAQVLYAVAPIFFVQMNDGFGVAVGAVDVPAGIQAFAEFLVVVDFAVEDDPYVSGFVTDGLVSGGDVNNAQAAHANADRAVGKNAVIIGAAVRHFRAHAAQRSGICLRAARELHHAGNATHV